MTTLAALFGALPLVITSGDGTELRRRQERRGLARE
nr:Antitoxin VapB [Candidatus Pantoea persica]